MSNVFFHAILFAGTTRQNTIFQHGDKSETLQGAIADTRWLSHSSTQDFFFRVYKVEDGVGSEVSVETSNNLVNQTRRDTK